MNHQPLTIRPSSGIVEEGQVFRWRRHQLHVAPEGLVWTEGKPFSPLVDVRGAARYEEVQAVSFAVVQEDARSIVDSAHRQVVDLLDLIILQAVYHRATDVPAGVYPRLLTRLKVVAKLTVYQKDAPQEGRIVAQVDDRSVDLRVTLLPTLHGERTTIRLFDPANGPRALNELGMLPDMQRQFERLLSRPQGTILFTGPANSGKTTTMYAALKHLHQTQQSLTSIATVEDPIEYDLQIINQTQINPASGLTFAAGLRTVLRQDPEVIMIGEIRDAETAEIAVRAGLTGHLILSDVGNLRVAWDRDFVHNNDSVNVLFLNGKSRSFTLKEWQARGWAAYRRSTSGGMMGMGGWQWSTTPNAPPASLVPPGGIGGMMGGMPGTSPPTSGGAMR